MSAVVSNIIDKYQGVAPKQVIQAVQKAAQRTGTDFSFLMEKAATESSFNPSAKAKTSSATGLFQFIESTWLNMVKEHGAKYGLGDMAEKIEVKNGRPCVTDAAARKEILNLRKNPEISALMACELSADNKEYLESKISSDVGGTELYLAHFMGAGGAAKFLSRRDENGSAIAAKLFPQEARANKNIFYDSKTSKARTLDGIYNLFAKKFSGDAEAPLSASASPTLAQNSLPLPPVEIAQASPLFAPEPASGADDVIYWNDKPESRTRSSGFSRASSAPTPHKISAENILLLAQMQQTEIARDMYQKPHYNS